MVTLLKKLIEDKDTDHPNRQKKQVKPREDEKAGQEAGKNDWTSLRMEIVQASQQIYDKQE